MKNTYCRIPVLMILTAAWLLFPVSSIASRQMIDSVKRTIILPEQIDRLICSGPGCLRLITYFQAQDLVVAVDDIESRKKAFDARPYSLANPQYKKLPIFGGFRGKDDPEKILGLTNQPQVIFKTYATMGYNPNELESKTGIPVVVLDYGDLADGRKRFFHSLTIIGQVLNKKSRARELIEFFTLEIQELEKRTKDISNKKSCFIGGIAFKGPHGFQSTEPSYPPFQFIYANNIADTGKIAGKHIHHSNFSKEKILASDPDILFLDLSTLQMGDRHSGLHELKTDPVYQAMTAVKSGQVYGVLPYNWYTQNFGSILADAWYIGKTLYPEKFADIDPAQKADAVYEFLLSKPVFNDMNSLFKKMAFKPVELVN